MSITPAPELSGVESIEELTDFFLGRRVVAVTGAGCSTESGIPDYGGLHSDRRRRTVQYKPFVTEPEIRRRYWARSTVGWNRVADAKPNEAHIALAKLEKMGVVRGVITQNVDGLHQRADQNSVVELHGSLSRVRCLKCDGVEPRSGFQERLLAANPQFRPGSTVAAPDGDAELELSEVESFSVPSCLVCKGVLKPDVVFFGESIPKPRVDSAWALYENADVLLVAGSSLAVFSGFRFVLRAHKENRPVAIINAGPTRGDGHAALKVNASVGDTLARVAARFAQEV